MKNSLLAAISAMIITLIIVICLWFLYGKPTINDNSILMTLGVASAALYNSCYYSLKNNNEKK